jgi:hypothetical protein
MQAYVGAVIGRSHFRIRPTRQFCTAAQTKSDLQANGSLGSVQTINADPHVRIKASLVLGSNRGAERTQLLTEEYASHYLPVT